MYNRDSDFADCSYIFGFQVFCIKVNLSIIHLDLRLNYTLYIKVLFDSLIGHQIIFISIYKYSF